MTKTTKVKKAKNKTFKYNVGDILEVQTFAGPKIHKKVLRKVHTTSKWQSLSDKRKKDTVEVKGFEGCFVRRKDLYSLKKHCVPYSGKEKLSKTESFTYDWQIIRIVRKSK
jgi:hypothetical protein